MSDLEEHLSPIRTNLSTIVVNKINDQEQNLIQQLRDVKVSVMEKTAKPSDIDLIRPEIMESWTRSFESGLDPFNFNYPPMLSDDDFAERLEEKAFFLEVADPYFCQFEKMLFDMGCYMVLTDHEGVILRISNTLKKNKFWLQPGSIWSEQTTGTCAHCVCIQRKEPIQVCGPEHFSQIFKHISCSSAPVFNACGGLEGTLNISSSYLHSQSSQTLGLVATIASAIQKEFQLSEKKALLGVALSTDSDPVVVINQCGCVITSNAKARTLFRKDLEGQDILGFFDKSSVLEGIVRSGNTQLNKATALSYGSQKVELISVQKISYSSAQIGYALFFKNDGAVLEVKNNRYHPKSYTFSRIVGSSDKTQETILLARKFSRFDNNILLQGESGTGKEVFAQSIHNEGRSDGPFIAINCAAIPASLIESELFGYEAGAFTGAERKGKPGKIEMANGGTLFLDEIGDMPLELQAVLLRVLEDKLVMRVGGSRYIPVDFKLVAATNKNLTALVEEKTFREDLYYRLSVFTVHISPLRMRGSDVIELADFFLSQTAQNYNMTRPVLSNAVKYYLLQYHWPGNVRQLQNVIAYAFCMCDGDSIQSHHLPVEVTSRGRELTTTESVECESSVPMIAESEIPPDESQLSMKDMEKMVIRKALDDTNNHVRAAAKALGISKSTIYRKIKEYEIIL